MKKIMMFFFISLSFTTYGQQLKPVVQNNTTGKSIVVVDIDTVQYQELTNIKERLTSFHDSNRNSQFLLITGTIITLAGVFLYKPDKTTDINPFPIIGGGLGLIGGFIYLDSFKSLNMRKKFVKKKN